MTDGGGAPGRRGRIADRVKLYTFDGNGRLAVVANPHAPTVTVAGMIQAGPATVDDGRFSLATVTAAMLDRGTENHDRLALAAELEDHGLQLDVRCSRSAPASVAFTVQGLAEQLPLMTTLLTEVLRRPAFPEEELAKVRERILGILQHERQDTGSRAYAAFTRLLYPPGHPLRRREIEAREAEVRGLTTDDLRAFHRARYGSHSLVCAVVGDVEAGEVSGRLGPILFGWGSREIIAPRVPDGVAPGEGEVTTEIPDRPNLDVFIGHAAGLRFGDSDHAAALLGNSCLGQSTLTSRLGVAVRDEAGLTYGINSGFLGTIQVPGPWATSLSVAAADRERALDLCRSVIVEFVASGPGEAELDDERQAWAGSYRVGLATNAGVALELVKTLVAGQDIDWMDRFPERLLATDRDQVTAAIRRHIHPERMVTSTAGSLTSS